MKRICAIIVILIFFVRFLSHVRAENSSTDVNKTIEALQGKIAELQGQEKSLSKEITIKNSQIALTILKIASTRAAISRLSTEIDELTNQIEQLEVAKTQRLELALHRAPESYKRRTVSVFGLIFLSKDFSELLARTQYLKRIQEEDARRYKQLQLTQVTYNERKGEREKKKVEQESLKKKLEAENRELESQKREKQALLDQTKNNESVYQQLLAQALAEKQALERALVESVAVGPVKKGDPIALVGNTGYPGCSTGAHLHFEVRKHNAWMNPGDYLSSKSIADDQDGGTGTFGHGDWSWPLQDPIRIEQHFGKTPYSWRYSYSGGIHTGYDLVSMSSSVIRAPKDGTLYSSSQPCGSGSIIKIKYIDHGDGILSFYLHVQ